MTKFRIAFTAVIAAVSGLFASVLLQSGTDGTSGSRPSTPLLRVADNNTPDGTETQDPEQQEQQAENQQQCGNPNGC